MKKTMLLLILLISLINQMKAQNVGLGTTTPDPSAEFEIQSSDKGLLTPRMTSEQREAIPNPAEGLVVYDTDKEEFWFYKNDVWAEIITKNTPPVNTTLTESLGIGTRPQEIVIQGDFAYVIDSESDDLKVINISDPSNPSIHGSLGLGNNPRDIVIQGDFVYIVDFGLKIINISNPAVPSVEGTLSGIGFNLNSIAVQGDIAYITNYATTDDLKIVNISNPASPTLIGSYTIGGNPTNIKVLGDFAYIVHAVSDDLKIVNISAPNNPSLISSLYLSPYGPKNLDIQGEYVYLIDNGIQDDLLVISVSDPNNPTVVGTLELETRPRSISVIGDFAYIVDEGVDGFKIVNISDPTNPILSNSFNLGMGSKPYGIAVRENHAYIVDQFFDDLKVVQLSEPTLLAAGLNGNTSIFTIPWNEGDNNLNTENKVSIGTFQTSSADPDIKLDVFDGHIALSNGFGIFAINNANNALTSGFDTDNQDFMIYAGGNTKMRINANGSTGIGRIAVTNQLEIEGDASKTSAGDWEANSDFRLKKNIQPLSSELILEKMLSLRGVRYKWNDHQTGTLRPDGFQYGFTAQNIQQYFPELVTKDNNGFLQTAYGTYDAIQLEALRALNDEIELLEKEEKDLKNKIEALKTNFHKLEGKVEGKLEGKLEGKVEGRESRSIPAEQLKYWVGLMLKHQRE